jgi:hypothetical protein
MIQMLNMIQKMMNFMIQTQWYMTLKKKIIKIDYAVRKNRNLQWMENQVE